MMSIEKTYGQGIYLFVFLFFPSSLLLRITGSFPYLGVQTWYPATGLSAERMD